MACSDFQKISNDRAWENEQFATLDSTNKEALILKAKEILERNIGSRSSSQRPDPIKTNVESEISFWQNAHASPTSPSQSDKQLGAITAVPRFMDPSIFAMISPSFLSGSLSPIESTDISQLTNSSFSVWSPSPFRNMLSPPPMFSSFEPSLSPFSSFAGSLSPISSDQLGCLPSGEIWGQHSNLTKFSHALVDFENLVTKTWESNLDYDRDAKEANELPTTTTENPLLNIDDLIRPSKPVPQPVLRADVSSKLLETQTNFGKEGSLLDNSKRSTPGLHFPNNGSTKISMSQLQQQPHVPIRPGLALVNNMYGSVPLSSQQDSFLISTNPISSSASTVPSTSLSVLPTNPNDGKKGVCNCKKSKCLKLYCECFSSGKYCTSCNCVECHNLPFAENQRQEAIKSILERNPKAFGSKINRSVLQQEREHHLSGCNCKKSSCLKKYCECYQAGVPCSARCKCVQCLNGLQGTSQAHPFPGTPKNKLSPEREIAPSGMAVVSNTKNDAILPLPSFASGGHSLSPAPATDPPTSGLFPSGLPPLIPARMFQYQMSMLANQAPLFPPNIVQGHLKKRQRVQAESNQPSFESWPLPTSFHSFHQIGSPLSDQGYDDGKRQEGSHAQGIWDQDSASQHISPEEKEVIKKETGSLPLKKMMLMQQQFMPTTTKALDAQLRSAIS